MDYGRPEKLVMSFHGLPKVSIARGDPYYGQCLESGQRLAGALGLTEADFAITFQSRFGPAEWLQPYTQASLESLARDGRPKRVDVVCPGFVSDCLETLEEIAIECKAAFLAAGGQEFRYIPCLNERHEWIEALARLVRDRLG
jgi:ferrochelatase